MKVRKIESKEKEERRRKKNQKKLGIIMIIILTIGIFGIVVSNFGMSDSEFRGQQRVIINEKEFLESRGFWITENPLKPETYLSFVYLPNETIQDSENISNINKDYSGKTLYIDTNSDEIFGSVYRNFYEIALRIQKGCIDAEDCDQNSPLKTCSENVLVIRESNETYINQEDNCVYIGAEEENLLKATEEFIYRYYNIN